MWDSRGVQETSSEQVEVGAAVRGALDQFETVHVALDLAVTPAEEERGDEGLFLRVQRASIGRERAAGHRIWCMFGKSWLRFAAFPLEEAIIASFSLRPSFRQGLCDNAVF